MDIYVLILPLLIGWILDKLLGDPVGLPHPVVGFGKLISFCEKRWNVWGTSDVERRGGGYYAYFASICRICFGIALFVFVESLVGDRPLRCACFLLFSRDYTY